MARRRGDQDSHSESAVREVVLRRLSHAPRTRGELSQDLSRRGVPSELVDSVLDGIEDAGLIDDAQFARLWVESRHRGRGLGRSVLRRELLHRGVEPDFIEDALGHIDSDAEMSRARELAERRLRALQGCDSVTQRRRLIAYLTRRGYPGSMSSAVVAEVLGSVDRAM